MNLVDRIVGLATTVPDDDGIDDPADLGTTTDEVTESATSMWETAQAALPRIGVALLMVAIAWMFSRLARMGLRRLWSRKQTPSFADVMSKLVGWVLLTIVVLLAVAVTFPSVQPVDLLASLGFFSLAIGFAFQDILENTLSGVLLLFRQPFRSGDEIEVQDQIGTVQAITIRETRIRTFDGQLVIIPNRDVYKSAIRVQTAFDARRIEVSIGVAFDSDIERAMAIIVDATREVDGVRTTPPPLVAVCGMSAKVMEINLWFWTEPRQLNAIVVTDRVVRTVKQRLDDAGIEMPAEIIALQATASFAAALRGEDVTSGGEVTPPRP